uniref:Staphylococcal nuclease domain-containing protein n=1 Tax=Panagrolaimus sp. JU765 TaxID=591449 RepID=A0AC34QNZ7_9BILA
MTDGATQPALKRGVVKQVLSGDAIVLQGPLTSNGPPKESTVYLANIVAPRLAKRPNDTGSGGSNDEPFAWEAREFLRKKIIGQSVVFVRDFIATSGREHGRIFLGGTSMENAENISESAVSEGWLEVRPGKVVDEQTQKLLDLQEKAKTAKKGKWGVAESDYQKYVRDIKWNVADTKGLVEKYHQKPIKAVVEQVRDASTVRVFLLPDFEYVTISLSGIKTPSPRTPSNPPEPFGEQAKFFVEQRILHRDVEVVLESVSNNNFLGSVIHPKGNIAVFLLKEGYAKCSWSVTLATAGIQALKEAEKDAQNKRLRLWANFTASSTDRKTVEGTVVEIGLGDSITVEKDNGDEIKLFFSSIRPPRKDGESTVAGGRKFLPLYDIPYMFEAREFLRKALIGKRVKATIDYVQPKSDQFPEKTCATVMVKGENIAAQLVERGLAKVVRHRQDDENRSSAYDSLLIAEQNAEKEKKALYSDKKPEPVRVQDLQGDAARANQFISYLKKTTRNDGVVEFLSSASRLRVYVPKETVVITFLLGGITAPRSARPGPGGKVIGENEPFADEAMKFTKRLTYQKEVKVEVESTDKTGAFIGYMFVQGENGAWTNLSELLVENGLASLHFSAERGPYYSALARAEKVAKEGRRGIWKNYVEETKAAVEIDPATEATERKINYKKVVVSEVVPSTFQFYAQNYEDGNTIVKLMEELQQIDSSTEGTARVKRNEIVAVKFSGRYHRAKVETVKGDVADIFYIDYGNREQVSTKKVAPLPVQFQARGPLSHEYVLAFASIPTADYYAKDASAAFAEFVYAQESLLLNVEYKVGPIEAASLVTNDENKRDVTKFLISEGYALAETRREKRFSSIMEQYTEAEKQARQGRLVIWQYGDARADD